MKYRVRLTHKAGSKERARLEHELWNAVKLLCRLGELESDVRERRVWFQTTFGGTVREYDDRSIILNSGTWAHTLFDCVDNADLRLDYAVLMVRRAKELAAPRKMKPGDALEQVYKQFDGTPRSIREAALKRVVEPEVKGNGAFSGARSKDLRAQIMHLVEEYVRDATEGWDMDDYHKTSVQEDFRISMDQLVDELFDNMSRAKIQTRRENIARIGAEKFAWACEVLAVPGKFGREIDMQRVMKQKRARLRDLHPDRNESESAVQEFRYVNEAYGILKAYAANFKRGKNGSN